MRNLKKPIIGLAISIMLCTLSFNANAKEKVEANNPIPSEYVSRIKQISLEDNIHIWDSKFLISSSTHNAAGSVGLVGIAFIKMAKTVMAQLETDIATTIPPEKDTIILKSSAFNAYNTEFTKKGVSTNTDNDLTLNLTIIDHGFHWSTSSALGVYIRVKSEVLSPEGKVLWEQIYYMDKDEKKIPHNRKSLNVKRGVEGLLADYESNSELLKETYDQIFGFLAVKLYSK